MKFKILFFTAALQALFPLLVWAQGFPSLKVLPWNGHKAACSLTFDGGDPSQLDAAVPELDLRNLRATFFLIANHTDRKDDWRKILPDGHEIGSCSLDDFHSNVIPPGEEESQVVGAHRVLQKEFGITVYSFAYPSGEITPALKQWAEKTCFLARGGNGTVPILPPNSEPDWMDIPSVETEAQWPFGTYKKWIYECLRKGGWLVWRFQSLEGSSAEQPVPRKIFGRILDDLQTKDIWVGTFLEVGSYFKAQKVFEKADIAKTDDPKWKKWTWDLPDHFPPHVVLKIRFDRKIKAGNSSLNVYPDESPESEDGDHCYTEVRQGKNLLKADSDGIYSIDFDAKELEASCTYVDVD